MDKLPIPDGGRAIVWKTFVNMAQTDPDLKRLIKTWQTFSGKPEEVSPIANGNMPSLRMSPYGLSASPEAINMQHSPMGVRVDMSVMGLDVTQLMNLWEVLENVYFKGDGGSAARVAINAALAAAGKPQWCTGLKLTQPAIVPGADEANASYVGAVGQFTIEYYVKK